MQYHAMSLLQASERHVRIIGYFSSFDGVQEMLKDGYVAGRVSFVDLPQMCAGSAWFHWTTSPEVPRW